MLKRDEKQLRAILSHLQRGREFLMSETVAVARKGKDNATTSLHYTRTDGNTLYEIDKGIGSDLTGIWEAERLLRHLLESQPKKGG
jgi:hypothetical protein